MVVDIRNDKLYVFIIILLLTRVAGFDIVLPDLLGIVSGIMISVSHVNGRAVGLAGVASPPKAVKSGLATPD